MRIKTALVCSVLLFVLQPAMAENPRYDEPGPYGTAYRVEDIAGLYETMTSSRIYYPSVEGVIPPEAVPCPIVVLGHGFMMGINRYYSYAEHLASWGYVVVLPTFSNPLFTPEHYTRAWCMVDAALFAGELWETPGDPFFGKIDTGNWGFCGHSMGGGCAFLAADTFDLENSLKVVVSFASPQTTPPVNSANLELPKLVLAGSVDQIAPWADVRDAMWADAPAPGAFPVITGANHGYYMDFSYWYENGGTATITRAEQQRIVRLYMTAYMERYLHGDDSQWNYDFCYGDSIQQTPVMELVEVRLPVSVFPESFSPEPGPLALQTGPNPFQGYLQLSLTVPAVSSVEASVYDPAGRMVAEITNATLEPGVHELYWNPGGLSAGVYIIQVAADGLPPEAVRVVYLR